jgi:hypothetical protein
MALARHARSGVCVVARGGARRTAVSLHVRPVIGLHVLAPRLLVPVATSPTRVHGTPPSPAQTALAAPAARRREAAGVTPPIVPLTPARFVDASLAHLVERTVERRVVGPGAPPAARHRAAPARHAAALPAELRRRAARHERPVPAPVRLVSPRRPDPVSPPPATTAAAVAAAGVLASTPSDWPAPAAPAVDVDALTGQVIQQLDRRLVAYRERMGRV